MRFNSIVFIEFAILFFVGWSLAGRRKPAALWYLVIASWLFYGYAAWWFVPILVGTATVDWLIALAMAARPSRRKSLLVFSCVLNLGVLCVFKYLGFFAQSLNGIFGTRLPIFHLVLPIGISFYTFQSLSYVIDVYRGETKPTKSWLEFLAIVSLFAHLVAGPIVRVSKILPQIRELRKPSPTDLWAGLDLICVGFFKKTVLADRLAQYVDVVYRDSKPSGGAAMLATVAFAFQIYYDFGGYTDIARGLARWLGLDFGLNFHHPYTAVGMADFWARWHISLTSWVRDYLYIPLGGNRKGGWKTHRNIWICMLLSGLWHGANLTFILWGFVHAVMLSIEKLSAWPSRMGSTRLGKYTAAGITFFLVSFAWVLFRADSVEDAIHIYRAMLHPGEGNRLFVRNDLTIVFILLASIIYEARILIDRFEQVRIPALTSGLLAVRNGVMLAMCLVAPGASKTFIYFQF